MERRIVFALPIRFGYFELCCDRQYDFVLHIIMRLLETLKNCLVVLRSWIFLVVRISVGVNEGLSFSSTAMFAL